MTKPRSFFAGYYVLWTVIAVLYFKFMFFEKFTHRFIASEIARVIPVLVIFAAFISLIIAFLPEISPQKASDNPPEFMFASIWYYVPKSADVLFQQVIIASMVHAANEQKINLATISLSFAVMFGAFHLLLILDGFILAYVLRFTIAATIFGLIAPYLYLHKKHGFQWAYGLHISFYALNVFTSHLEFS